ncbi:MAG: enoyl-CoA hydratase-related protein, partial [Acidimicrobiia bacterium]|nr:enoyl-CoA hydratase-related protein [Acidimicrobiia bacterium]
MSEHLQVDRHEGVATVVLDDHPTRNALSTAVLDALHTTLEDLGAAGDTDVIVIGHTGPAFSAGHDLREMTQRDLPFYEALFDRCAQVMQLLHTLPQPVIARVDGVATAAGCQLVASCDLVVASDRSSFATPGVRIGLFCSTPMVALSRSIGQKRAMEMLLTGQPIDAATAAGWGLVNRVVAPDEVGAEVAALAATLRRFSPHTVALGKAAF